METTIVSSCTSDKRLSNLELLSERFGRCLAQRRHFFVAYFAYQTEAEIDAFGFSLGFSMMFTSMIHVVLQTSRIH